MSVDFRQRKPSEYLKILRRRKWLLILPVIAVTTAVGYVVYRLPNVYESETLIVVRPSNLPTSVITGVSEDTMTRQLTSINQVVTSRSSLEPLVEKYDLYRVERGRGEAMETIIDTMRDNIRVAVNTSRNDITNGFNIAYRYREPKIAQAITSELASKYINVQTADTISSTVSAENFINQQVAQAQEAVAAVDKDRVGFMSANIGKLPSEAQSLLNQLTGLREEQKGLMTEVGRLQDRRATVVSSMATVQQQSDMAIEDVATNLTDPKTTLAWSQLVSRKAQLEGEQTRMEQEYTKKHPDVIAKKEEVKQIQEQMDQMIAEWKEKVKEKEAKLKGRPNLTVSSLQNDIKMIDGEIKRQQALLAQNEQNIAGLVTRINNVPGVEVQLTAIERDYQTKKSALDQLLLQQQKIRLNKEAATQQQNEGIEVVDTANLPSQAVAPRRLLLSSVGLAVGLGLGLLLIAIFEGPRLLTIQNAEDARHYTGLPVLLSVPELLTPQEARAVPRRRRLLLAAGVVATLVSIPMLALALKLTHVFEYLMTASGGRS
ncbi:MAG TPA: Wzz/FepE/Etk N-terminal domain-containing protein [Pyrinomonadaceae bacterium]|jgi:polysaccharide chain length determinant protein (PEP-CTERM system associated)|nr:Wzz/FepE/Etk N-terminal domain-containing protein [Pyrinomonadaceae bacterium]